MRHRLIVFTSTWVIVAAIFAGCRGDPRPPLTQDEYAWRVISMEERLGHVELIRERECGIHDSRAETIREVDAEVQSGIETLRKLDEDMEALQRREGIFIPEGFDARYDRVGEEEWRTMAVLAFEFIDEVDTLVESYADAYRAQGCDIPQRVSKPPAVSRP